MFNKINYLLKVKIWGESSKSNGVVNLLNRELGGDVSFYLDIKQL